LELKGLLTYLLTYLHQLNLILIESNRNPNPTTKQHAEVGLSIQQFIVACPTYPEKFIRDNITAPMLLFLLLSVVIVTRPHNG